MLTKLSLPTCTQQDGRERLFREEIGWETGSDLKRKEKNSNVVACLVKILVCAAADYLSTVGVGCHQLHVYQVPHVGMTSQCSPGFGFDWLYWLVFGMGKNSWNSIEIPEWPEPRTIHVVSLCLFGLLFWVAVVVLPTYQVWQLVESIILYIALHKGCKYG